MHSLSCLIDVRLISLINVVFRCYLIRNARLTMWLRSGQVRCTVPFLLSKRTLLFYKHNVVSRGFNVQQYIFHLSDVVDLHLFLLLKTYRSSVFVQVRFFSPLSNLALPFHLHFDNLLVLPLRY